MYSLGLPNWGRWDEEKLGHWVCSYYDGKNIFIYDSLNNKTLHDYQKQFLVRLFLTYNFDRYPVKFPTVQHQPNSNDCEVFAIAFAISLFNIKPDKVRYDSRLMRPHLLNIFELNVIEHFPQDSQYDACVQNVLSLEVIRRREVKAARKRAKRENETDEQKSICLEKRRLKKQSDLENIRAKDANCY